MKKVVLFGGFGAPNFGDELILRSILNFYADHSLAQEAHILTLNANYTNVFFEYDRINISSSDVVSRLTWDDPEISACDHLDFPAMAALMAEKVASGRSFAATALDRVLSDADLVQVCGGGYIYEHWIHAVKGLAAVVALAIRRRVPIIATGLTIVPGTGRFESFLRDSLGRAAFVDIRDDAGLAFLRHAGIEPVLSCDDAFYLGNELSNYSYVESSTREGINIQLSTDFINDPRYQGVVKALKPILERDSERSVQWRGYEFFRASPELRDEMALRPLLQKTETTLISMPFVPYQVAVREFARGRAGVGIRHHFAILSFLTLQPVLTVRFSQWDRRIAAVHDAFSSPWLVDAEELTAELVQTFLSGADEQDRRTMKDQREELFNLKREVLLRAVSSAASWHR